MCVITICKNKRELPENLRSMAIDNPDGTGVIWYSKEGIPTYKKGLTIKEVIELNKILPFPYAFHFRITTVGTNKLLTHPYEISHESKLRMEGQADALLMHNGHWSDWNDAVLEHAIKSGVDCPEGDWSDSRAMAHLGGSIGINMLKMLTGQKIAIFKKNRQIHIFGQGWENGDKGILYSNKNWESKWGRGYKYQTDHGYWQDGVFFKEEKEEETKKGAITQQPELPITTREWNESEKRWVEIKKEVTAMKEKNESTKAN